MSCQLLVTGKDFDVDEFLSTSLWRENVTVFHQGEPTCSKLQPIRNYSGFSVDISSQDEESLDRQVQDATEFLERNVLELERLVAFSHIDEVVLRIGVFWLENTVCCQISIPPLLLLLTGKYGISLEINTYLTSAK
jgi:hypothetical protein